MFHTNRRTKNHTENSLNRILNKNMPQKRKFIKKPNPHGLQNLPTLNADVISSICSWLGLRDVKNCRLVCHDWNIAAKPILKKKSVINLTCNFWESDFARNDKFQSDMASFGRLHHVHLEMGNHSMVNYRWLRDPDYVSDAKFFTNYLFPRKLGITAKITSVKMSQFLEIVLLSCSNLVQVELGLHIEEDMIKKKGDDLQGFRTGFCEGKVFNKVKRLDLPFSPVN
ncbi:uncharacterized protein LOC118437823 [Folsomia candida]|uniref:uncharacterized protein LOC118437823 n=1 Tax=Folsomia candida TaxID=158441 RepID=UPI00160532B8|nr:uncharacterized protein LOC118437823 [Folsomia candida]